MITLTLTKDEITPDLRKLLKEAESDSPLGSVLGRAAANTLKKHFRQRNTVPNKLGGARTNFWSRIAESVQAPRQEPGRIIVPVSHPAIAQKVFGGTITPKKAKNIAIPIDPRAHGKSPRVFPLLEFAVMKSGAKLLGLKNGRGGMDWLYVLVKSVKQDADPNALPKPETMAESLTKAGEIYLRNRK
ncbi:MAG: hypothetical protein ABIS50_15150 [Luteolibacter sp.]|uniref:hypothetical protein n=1 Tax=Luteolibacter sp. TaxID=1962973 RepID=UPI00326704CD